MMAPCMPKYVANRRFFYGGKGFIADNTHNTRKACIFVNASAFARRCWRPAIHAASAPHVGLPTHVLYGQMLR